MARRIAIGAAWWLAAAYAFQVGAFIYNLPPGVAQIAALPIAALAISVTRPRRVNRPADLRRIYQPKPDAPGPDAEPAILGR